MSSRFLFGMGLAFLLVLAGGIAAVVGVTSVTDRPSVSDISSVDKVPPAPISQAQPSVAISSVMPNAVLNSDLDSLAAAVKLQVHAASPSVPSADKDVWAKEIPLAQKLMNGNCDCDQRNWLKHFVETGQQAVSGSSLYPESFRLLATLRRSDEDVVAAQPAQ